MELVELALSFVPSLIVVLAVLKQSKSISAFAQLGSIGQRNWDSANSNVLAKPDDDEKKKKLLEDAKNLVMDRDKIFFTWTAFNIGFTCFIVGRFPQYFHLWHIPKFVLLTGTRWILFKGEGKHYLLYDFCYWANGLSLWYVLGAPQSGEWFQVFFLAANGPLAWSILAFSQSLVLHSPQHMISVFIHTSPMMLTLCLRWSPTPAFKTTTDTPGADSVPVMLMRGVLWFYLPWVVFYYLWVFIAMADRVKQRGYQTLFDRVTAMAVGKKITGFKDSTEHQLLRKAAYLSAHMCFGVATMYFACLMYHNEWAHWTFALCILSASAWNGSSFYSKVWATKYMSQVQEQASQQVLQQEKQSSDVAAGTVNEASPRTKQKEQTKESQWQGSLRSRNR